MPQLLQNILIVLKAWVRPWHNRNTVWLARLSCGSAKAVASFRERTDEVFQPHSRGPPCAPPTCAFLTERGLTVKCNNVT
eukprot:6462188-Amphidinium_carterae.2